MTRKPLRTAALSSVRSKPKLILSIAEGLAAILLLTFAYLYVLSRPVAKTAPSQDFVIQKGESAIAIAKHLKTQGLIRSPLYFRLLVKLQNLSLQAGNFSLSPSSTPLHLAQQLTKGYGIDISITIPEGFRREQIAEVVEQKLGIKSVDFLGSAPLKLEGYLFPDTYSFAKEVTADEVVQSLRANFDKRTTSLNLSVSDVILASILERETLSDAEKPIVAGILSKRLKEGWPLEVDASIQYIMGNSKEWWPVPLLGDRARKSPYNTYLNKGLPPTPIGNPGLTSLKAVISPESSPYYFYLHDKSGAIHYAVTNAEHEANVAKYIRN